MQPTTHLDPPYVCLPSGLYHARSGRILQRLGPNQEVTAIAPTAEPPQTPDEEARDVLANSSACGTCMRMVWDEHNSRTRVRCLIADSGPLHGLVQWCCHCINSFFPSNAFMAFARSLHTFNRSKKMNCKLSCKAVYPSIASKALVMDQYTVQWAIPLPLH